MPRRPTRLAAGLCETCVHQEIVRNTRGSVFHLCARSKFDTAYPRYPRLPVMRCPGYVERVEYEPADETEGSAG